jgi:hypothetical protein
METFGPCKALAKALQAGAAKLTEAQAQQALAVLQQIGNTGSASALTVSVINAFGARVSAYAQLGPRPSGLFGLGVFRTVSQINKITAC